MGWAGRSSRNQRRQVPVDKQPGSELYARYARPYGCWPPHVGARELENPDDSEDPLVCHSWGASECPWSPAQGCETAVRDPAGPAPVPRAPVVLTRKHFKMCINELSLKLAPCALSGGLGQRAYLSFLNFGGPDKRRLPSNPPVSTWLGLAISVFRSGLSS